MPRTLWLDVRHLEHYGVVVDGLRYWWGWHPWHWCRMGCGDCRVIFADRVEPLRPYVAPEQHPQRPKFRGQPRTYPPRGSRLVLAAYFAPPNPLPPLPTPPFGLTRPFPPRPGSWTAATPPPMACQYPAVGRMTYRQALAVQLLRDLAKPDISPSPVRALSLQKPWAVWLAYLPVHLSGVAGRLRGLPRWRYFDKRGQYRPRTAPPVPAGPTIRRRWPTAEYGYDGPMVTRAWSRAPREYGPFPEEARWRLIDHSSDDRWTFRPKAGSGRKHERKKVTPLTREDTKDWTLAQWMRFAKSDANLGAGWEDRLMLGDRIESPMGAFDDGIVLARDERWRSTHERYAKTDWTFDIPAAEDTHGVERSRARHRAAIIAREQRSRDDERDHDKVMYRELTGTAPTPLPILGAWMDKEEVHAPTTAVSNLRGEFWVESNSVLRLTPEFRPEVIPLGWSRTRLRHTGDMTSEDETVGHETGSNLEAVKQVITAAVDEWAEGMSPALRDATLEHAFDCLEREGR